MPPPESFAPLPNEYVNFDLISQGELVMRIRNIPKVSFANIELFPNFSLILFICSYIYVALILFVERCEAVPGNTLRLPFLHREIGAWLAIRTLFFQRCVFSHSKMLFCKNYLGC